jgi:hypothetical protein
MRSGAGRDVPAHLAVPALPQPVAPEVLIIASLPC